MYSGRPRNEEPHVKRTIKKKAEKIEYILRVDLVSLKPQTGVCSDFSPVLVDANLIIMLYATFFVQAADVQPKLLT